MLVGRLFIVNPASAVVKRFWPEGLRYKAWACNDL